MFPAQRIISFYGKHLQLVTVVLFVALPASWTIILAGIFGVFMVSAYPMILIQAPPLLFLIIIDIGVLVFHLVLVHRVAKEAEHFQSVLRTEKMARRVIAIVVGLYVLFIPLFFILGRLDSKEPLTYFSWVYAFVFWSYWFQLPWFFSFLG